MTKEQKAWSPEPRAAQKKNDELMDALLEEQGIGWEAVLGPNGLMARVDQAGGGEKALAGELTHHLGDASKGEPPGENCRNGSSVKTVIGEDGPVEIAVLRAGSFEPRLIGKRQRRFAGFDEKIIAMNARGMSVREIQGFPLDQYKVEVVASRCVLTHGKMLPGAGAVRSSLPHD